MIHPSPPPQLGVGSSPLCVCGCGCPSVSRASVSCVCVRRAPCGVLTLSEKPGSAKFQRRLPYGAPSFQKPGFWRQTSGKE
eukprot:5882494-Prymnesium_polylepis.1